MWTTWKLRSGRWNYFFNILHEMMKLWYSVLDFIHNKLLLRTTYLLPNKFYHIKFIVHAHFSGNNSLNFASIYELFHVLEDSCMVHNHYFNCIWLLLSWWHCFLLMEHFWRHCDQEKVDWGAKSRVWSTSEVYVKDTMRRVEYEVQVKYV